MNIQRQWNTFMKTQRLAMVTTLPHMFVERWTDLHMSNLVIRKDLFSKLIFTLKNQEATYNITYENHDFLFILMVEETNTNQKLLHFDHLGLRVIADDYKDQQDTWKQFAEDLRSFCHDLLLESKGGSEV